MIPSGEFLNASSLAALRMASAPSPAAARVRERAGVGEGAR